MGIENTTDRTKQMNPVLTTYTGTLEKIFFQNTENSWAAILILTDKGPRKASGLLPGLRLGMTIKVSGQLQDSKYGESLNIQEFEEVYPSDIEGIEKYLASGLIKNIGPKLAHEIVQTFKEATLNILDYEPERLVEVNGVGKKRIKSIIDAVKEQKEIRTIMIWLKRYDLSNGLAAKIYKTYGKDSLDMLQENPYRLCDDISGVGFKKADDVAGKIGIAKESIFRIFSGINACLEDNACEGNTYMPYSELLQTVSSDRYLSLDSELIDKALKKDDCEPITDGDAVFLPAYYYAEQVIATSIKRLQKTPVPSKGEIKISMIERETGVTFSREQKDAIRNSLLAKVSVITGGPGTGKTVTTNAIIRQLLKEDKTVLLAAPTGRAAKRMKEVTGMEAQTIHRLLGFTQGEFQYNKDVPLEGDALIVDESSMIDTLLMRHLIEAVPNKMQLILVGDVDQLPSVGAGCVLRDIIDSQCVTTTRLTEIFRQAQGSDIIMNAHAVNQGLIPRTDNHTGTDFWFFAISEKEKVADTIIELVCDRIPKKFGYKKDDIQVLSPMKREFDPIGSTILNRRLQAVVNPNGECAAKRGDTEFRIGDRIMQTKNDYDKAVFNGDMGIILRKGDESDEQKTLLVADFDGVEVNLSRADLQNIELAYSCTVHKSQGSEYPVVIIPVHESQYVMLKRNLVYTGITRAKKQCILVGSRRALAIAVQNEDTRKRFTRLKERIQASATPG